MAGRDDALFAISNTSDPETDDRRRRFRLKRLSLTPMTFASASTVSGLVFGKFLGGYEGGYEIPVAKMDSSAPDLPSTIKVLSGSTIAPGYDLLQDVGGLQNYLFDFSDFGLGTRYLMASTANNLHLPSTGDVSSMRGSSGILNFRGAAASTTVGVQLTSGGFAFAIKSLNPDSTWNNVWNANVMFTVNGNTYCAVFDFIPSGTSLGLADNAIDVAAPQTTTVPFMIRNDAGSSYVIEIKTIDIMLAGSPVAQNLFTDQTTMRLCRISTVSGGVEVSPSAGNTSSSAPSQLSLRVNRAWSPLVAPMAAAGLDPVGDLGYPSANQGIVRKINILGRRLQTFPFRSAAFGVFNTPDFNGSTLRGLEWSYDTAPMISAGESLALIQENAVAWGGWWVDAVVIVDSLPQTSGSSYAFIG